MDSMDMGLSKFWEMVKDRGSMGSERAGLSRKLSTKELMLLNYGVGEDS